MKQRMVYRLAAMAPKERKALKRRVLALFRRAEMRAVKGRIDDANHQSLHLSSKKAGIRLV